MLWRMMHRHPWMVSLIGAHMMACLFFAFSLVVPYEPGSPIGRALEHGWFRVAVACGQWVGGTLLGGVLIGLSAENARLRIQNRFLGGKGL